MLRRRPKKQSALQEEARALKKKLEICAGQIDYMERRLPTTGPTERAELQARRADFRSQRAEAEAKLRELDEVL